MSKARLLFFVFPIPPRNVTVSDRKDIIAIYQPPKQQTIERQIPQNKHDCKILVICSANCTKNNHKITYYISWKPKFFKLLLCVFVK